MCILAKMSGNLLGFKILKFLELCDWKVLKVDGSIPFEENLLCPCGEENLRTLCTLVGNEGKQKIRIGCCPSCGYIGYINRPSGEWISRFYAEMWDKRGEKGQREEEVKEEGRLILSKDKRRMRNLEKLMQRFEISRQRPVLEIGSGYGGTLKLLEALGFENLVGTEASLHRAEAGSNGHNLQVLAGAFEDEHVQSELRTKAPFGLIFSHHVLEHTLHPDKVIEAASRLQEPEDFLLLSLPNAAGEPTLSSVLYFPHLHSFTKYSLETLLQNHHYEVVDDSFTKPRELSILAKKTSRLPKRTPHSGDGFAEGRNKLIQGLDLGTMSRKQRRLIACYRHIDIGVKLPLFQTKTGEEIEKALLPRFLPFFHHSRLAAQAGRHRASKRHAMLLLAVETLSRRFTSPEESPLEVQFEGNIMLTYK